MVFNQIRKIIFVTIECMHRNLIKENILKVLRFKMTSIATDTSKPKPHSLPLQFPPPPLQKKSPTPFKGNPHPPSKATPSLQKHPRLLTFLQLSRRSRQEIFPGGRFGWQVWELVSLLLFLLVDGRSFGRRRSGPIPVVIEAGDGLGVKK